MDELTQTVEITNKLGMHARAAAKFVNTASTFSSHVEVERNGHRINGKSIMGVMMLAAECGSTLTIRALGDDAEEALEALATLVSERFGETESDYEIEN